MRRRGATLARVACLSAPLAFGVPGPGVAAVVPPTASVPVAAAAQTAPVQTLDGALLAAMKIGQAGGFAARAKVLTPAVDSAFDMKTIVRLIVGPGWATTAPDMQQKLLDAFRAYTVANYAANFDSYSGQMIRVVPPVRSFAGGSIVDTEIQSPDGHEDRISYSVRQVDGDWKIEDVLLDGTISNLAVQRSDFQRILAEGGPTKLIERLDAHAAALAKGNG